MAKHEGSSFERGVVRGIDFIAFYFPGLIVVGWAWLFYRLVSTPNITNFALFGLFPYIVPLTLYRLLTWFSPICQGGSIVEKGRWSSWFIAYRLQLIFVHFPFLEGALLTFPGAFGLWLRLWGSTIGKRVFWASTVHISDRGHLDIADDVFFGSDVHLFSHVMKKSGTRGILYVNKVTIGAGAFIGAGSRFGPGAKVQPAASVPLLTDLYVNDEFPMESSE